MTSRLTGMMGARDGVTVDVSTLFFGRAQRKQGDEAQPVELFATAPPFLPHVVVGFLHLFRLHVCRGADDSGDS